MLLDDAQTLKQWLSKTSHFELTFFRFLQADYSSGVFVRPECKKSSASKRTPSEEPQPQLQLEVFVYWSVEPSPGRRRVAHVCQNSGIKAWRYGFAGEVSHLGVSRSALPGVFGAQFVLFLSRACARRGLCCDADCQQVCPDWCNAGRCESMNAQSALKVLRTLNRIMKKKHSDSCCRFVAGSQDASKAFPFYF